MVDQEEKSEINNQKDVSMENIISTDQKEEKEDTTTLFAVRTTINQESNILRQIFYRFSIIDVVPDIRAMLISSMLPGYVFFEAPQKRDVQIAVQGVPHIKGRIVQNVKLTEIKHVLLPRSVTEFISIGDTVEIISGVFEGSRAVVLRMPHDSSSSEEVVVRLLQEETPITIKIHGDYLKLVEKKRKEVEPEPVLEVKVSEEMATDLDKAISFDDELESEYDEEYGESGKEEKTDEFGEEEEEVEEDDEWSKFDGF